MRSTDPAEPAPLPTSPLSSTEEELPPAVAAALGKARLADVARRRSAVEAAGITWATYAWGSPSQPPLVLVHGVTSNAETFWRIAPAVAESGRHVVAVDLPGHGRTAQWRGRYRFRETATDLAACIRAAGLERPELAVLGHSWGGLVAANLPGAGLRPERLILLDAPALPASTMELMTHDPLELPYENLATAEAAIRAENPGWTSGDIEAKALGLTQFDPSAVLAVLIQNGDWDAGLSALAGTAARDLPVWVIRGEFRHGGLIPDAALPAIAARVGVDHILTIAGAPHSPQRLYPAATVAAILRALA